MTKRIGSKHIAQHRGKAERIEIKRTNIAREAVRRYVERHDEAFLAEAKRQSLVAAAHDRHAKDEDWDAMFAESLT